MCIWFGFVVMEEFKAIVETHTQDARTDEGHQAISKARHEPFVLWLTKRQ